MPGGFPGRLEPLHGFPDDAVALRALVLSIAGSGEATA
jgi:hypothetical protein